MNFSQVIIIAIFSWSLLLHSGMKESEELFKEENLKLLKEMLSDCGINKFA